MANKLLNDARQNKKDEFYTQLSDIERELAHYKEHFRGKTVLCNCDDPRVSNFFHYFAHQFEALGEGKGFSHGLWKPESGIVQPMVRGERKYKRIFIRRRKHS